MASHGAKINAANSDNIIATDPNAGIGAIYGPIMPDTKPIGMSAATTV